MLAMNTAALISAVILTFTSTVLAEVPKDITKPADIVEYERGVAAATNDFKKGVIRYEIIGLPDPNLSQEVKDKAKKNYNIDVVFHGCIPGPRVDYDRGYLDTVVKSLKKQYGFDPVRPDQSATSPEIPYLLALPDPPRENIRKTCRHRWQVQDMKLNTFQVRPDRNEYVVECDGIIDGELYHCVIRTDSTGNWINDGRTRKTP